MEINKSDYIQFTFEYTTDARIFWTKNSVDRPNRDYFKEIIDSANWIELVNLSPNYINQFNAQIVVNTPYIRYLRLKDRYTNRTLYFTVDRINKVLKSKAYLIDITVDLYSSYVYDFFNSIELINLYPTKINRTTAWGFYINNPTAQITPDPLINGTENGYLLLNVSPRFNGGDDNGNGGNIVGMFWNDEDNTRRVKVRGYLVSKNGQITNKGYGNWCNIHKYKGGLYSLKNMVWDMYQETNGDIILFPYCESEFTSNNLIVYTADFGFNFFSDLGTQFPGAEAFRGEYYCFNEYGQLQEYIKNNAYFVNKFKGTFIIPNWWLLINSGTVNLFSIEENGFSYKPFWALRFKYGVNQLNQSPSYRYFYRLNLDSYRFDKTSNKYDLVKNNLTDFTNNNNNDLNLYLISKATNPGDSFSYLNIQTMTPWIVDLSNNDGFINMNFITSENKLMFSTSNNIFSLNYCVNSMETLPNSTSQYAQYLAANLDNQNFGLSVAKQQFGFGIANNIFNHLSSGIKGVGQILSGDIGGAISTGFSSTYNFVAGTANSVLQYQNAHRSIQIARSTALKTSTANNIYPSNEISNLVNQKSLNYYSLINWNYYESNINYSYIKYFNMYWNTTIKAWNPSPQLQQVNNLICDFGYNIQWTGILPQFAQEYGFNFKLDDDFVNEFIYWDWEFNEEHIRNYFRNQNTELAEAITMLLNNPVRFWKVAPKFNNKTLYMRQSKKAMILPERVENENQ